MQTIERHGMLGDAAQTIIIRLVGDSGDGMQLIGEQLTITAALMGKEVRTLPDFPAEIRAPAGTIAGVSGFQLAMSEEAIFTAGETLQVLVALNPAALKHSLQYLQHGGLLIINEDNFKTKDWEKAGLSADLLNNVTEYYQVIFLPLITLTMQATATLEVNHSVAKKAKNFYILGLVLWLFDLDPKYCLEFINVKFKSNQQIIQINALTLMAGFNYAMTLELSRQRYILGQVKRSEGVYRQITGVEAVAMALATLTTTTKTSMLVAGYPITPASAILHECTKLSDFGVQLFQAEDEIAAIGACIGAAYGGNLALTCTSGPGFDLKTESLGLAVMAELPLVVIDVQRAGASTGLPTKTSQSDLEQALYGRHSEAPLPVFAAKSPADCFNIILEAFAVATKYMTPVIVLLDAYLANAAEPWRLPLTENSSDCSALPLPTISYNRFAQPFQRDENLSRSWNLPGTPGFIHQIGGLEKQGEAGQVSYDAENHQKMIAVRANKIAGIIKEYPPLEVEGDVNASTLLIGWGSTYGSLKTLLQECKKKGKAIALIQLRYLNPLPQDLAALLRRFSKVIVVELNSGQLYRLLRATYLIDAQLISQCNGQPFSVRYLMEALRSR